MTKEQFNRIAKYELIFNSAINSNYLRALDSRFAADMYAVMKELNIRYDVNCGSCMFNAVVLLGKQYFNFKDQKPTSPEVQIVSAKTELPEKSGVVTSDAVTSDAVTSDAVKPKKSKKTSKKQ